MRLRRYIKEEYFANFEQFGEYIEIFKNPTRKEMMDASDTHSLSHDPSGRNVRFIIDLKNKDLYVWHPNSYHIDAAKAIAGSDGYDFMTKTGLPGVASYEGGKWVMTSSDEMDGDSYYEDFWRSHQFPQIAKAIDRGDFSDFKWLKAIDIRPFFSFRSPKYVGQDTQHKWNE